MESDYQRALDHSRYNTQHLRVLLGKSQIEALPVMALDRPMHLKKMCGWFWNGLEWYPEDMEPLEGEVGYDQDARYIMK